MVGHDKVFIIRNHTTILHTVPNLRFLSKNCSISFEVQLWVKLFDKF